MAPFRVENSLIAGGGGVQICPFLWGLLSLDRVESKTAASVVRTKFCQPFIASVDRDALTDVRP